MLVFFALTVRPNVRREARTPGGLRVALRLVVNLVLFTCVVRRLCFRQQQTARSTGTQNAANASGCLTPHTPTSHPSQYNSVGLTDSHVMIITWRPETTYTSHRYTAVGWPICASQPWWLGPGARRSLYKPPDRIGWQQH